MYENKPRRVMADAEMVDLPDSQSILQCTQDYFHHKMKEFENEGIQNFTQCTSALQVYMDLCEVRGWWNVRVHPCKELNVVFISGHPKRQVPRELVLPVLSSDTMSPEVLQEYLRLVHLDDYQTEGLTLAVCDTDSTTVYYRITQGLVQPDSPECAERKKLDRVEHFRKRHGKMVENIEVYRQKRNRLSECQSKIGDKT